MRVVIAGASGFLGGHLSDHLRVHGHEVTALVRRPVQDGHEARWDPYAGELDAAVIEAADVVVNLAGTPLVGNVHSKTWAVRVLQSRVVTTRVLAGAIAAGERKPAFLAGNGIAYYGHHGSEQVTEASDSRGDAFLTRVAHAWQAATEPAAETGARVCVLRSAPVMDRTSPPLRQLRPLFRLGLGPRLGDGSQHMPIVSLRDWVGAVAFLAESHDVSGPFNICCPEPPTNAEFTRALARALRRPAFLAVPRPVLEKATGQMAPEVLGSVNARPAALERAGYDFQDQDVTDVLATALA